MTENPARQPRGIPVGGQFSATSHGEPDIQLQAPAIDYSPLEPAADAPLPRPAETQRRLRGHNFYPGVRDMDRWPAIGTNQETLLAEIKMQAHYFQGNMDWYVAEYDPKTKNAWGYADLGFGMGEWGDFHLPEIEAVRGNYGMPIERELHFKRGTLAHECIKDL
ncbi:DUF2958 domain-containing protein [Arthrobacter sp. HLT1-21]